MFDLHCHSNNSFDSKESIDSMIKSAISKNIKFIAFTEHYSSNKNKKTYGHFNKLKFDSEITESKNLYSNKIEILKGLEICEPHLENFNNLNKDGFDFILGSIHNVGNLGLRALALKEDNKTAYKIYFKEYLKMVTYGEFTIAAHLDLMNRYAFDTLGNYDFNENKYLIKDILKTLINRNKGLEINCSGLKKSVNSFHPSIEVLKLYKSLGGEIITIGSDAHKANDIAFGYDYVLNIVKNLGFEYIYTFSNFKAIKHRINLKTNIQ